MNNNIGDVLVIATLMEIIIKKKHFINTKDKEKTVR
jgi:hypothetical protein